MNAIQQFAEISSDRRNLRLEHPLPETVPCGKARVEIRFIVSDGAEPLAQPRKKRPIGFLKGQISCPDDFDTMGQEEIIAMFEGTE